jgi:hypothetical protein
VPSRHLNILQEQASSVGVVFVLVTGPALRERLAAAMAQAADTQAGTPGYPAELQLWTHRHAGATTAFRSTACRHPRLA